MARRPTRLAVALASGLSAGLVVGGLGWLVARSWLDGFWLWYGTLAVAALVAGAIFAGLAREDEPAG
ncbi:hypothetical protein [Plantactinospora sp. GCM10030261]|uniref:hypothetical protein n=1 Tax=Plantactinospora sp. GCM10030261 TaxID=3273420 RepID=UPI0036083902